jgi:hypothetical protein
MRMCMYMYTHTYNADVPMACKQVIYRPPASNTKNFTSLSEVRSYLESEAKAGRPGVRKLMYPSKNVYVSYQHSLDVYLCMCVKLLAHNAYTCVWISHTM